MAHLWFILICLIWGSSFILMKYAGQVFGPLSIGGWRVVGGAAFLGVVWLALTRAGRWPMKRRDLPALSVVVLVGSCWPFVVQPHLIVKYQDSAFFGMMVALVPLITIALSVPMLGLRPTGRQLAGVALGLACLMVLLGVGLAREMAVGDLLLAASVPLTYATSNTWVKRRFQDHSPLALTMSALGGAAIILLPMGLAAEPVDRSSGDLGLAVLCLALLGVLGSGLAWFLFLRLIQQRGPLFAGMVTYVVPIGALAWGWWDGETISTGQAVALLGVLAGVALVQTGSSKPATPRPTGT